MKNNRQKYFTFTDYVEISALTHPLAPEEFKGGVAVGEVVWPPQDAPSLRWQALAREHLQQREQLCSVAQVFHKALIRMNGRPSKKSSCM